MNNKDIEGNQKAEQENLEPTINHNDQSIISHEENTEKKSSNANGIELEDIQDFDDMPPEIRRQIQSFMSMQVGGFRHNPLFDKFTESHIDKYLDYIQRDDDHEFYLRKTNRWFVFVYSVIALGVFIAGVVYLLPDDKDLLIQLIMIIVAIAGGIGGGYGLSKRKS